MLSGPAWDSRSSSTSTLHSCCTTAHSVVSDLVVVVVVLVVVVVVPPPFCVEGPLPSSCWVIGVGGSGGGGLEIKSTRNECPPPSWLDDMMEVSLDCCLLEAA